MTTLALAVLLAFSLQTLAQQPSSGSLGKPVPLVTNPKPVKPVPVTLKCDDGWQLVLAGNGRPMCARELKEPTQQ